MILPFVRGDCQECPTRAELLAALRAILDCMKDGTWSDENYWKFIHTTARAAIAKAERRQHACLDCGKAIENYGRCYDCVEKR